MNDAAMQDPVHVDIRRVSQRFRSGRRGDLLALDRVDL
jgi:NitT/TauT family transport system ATP-binding protein